MQKVFEESFFLFFQVKTNSRGAILFYNTGPAANQDFVALEIWKGTTRMLINQVINQSTSCMN